MYNRMQHTVYMSSNRTGPLPPGLSCAEARGTQ